MVEQSTRREVVNEGVRIEVMGVNDRKKSRKYVRVHSTWLSGQEYTQEKVGLGQFQDASVT